MGRTISPKGLLPLRRCHKSLETCPVQVGFGDRAGNSEWQASRDWLSGRGLEPVCIYRNGPRTCRAQGLMCWFAFLAEKETLCKHPRRKASLQCICVSCVSQAGVRKACRTGSSPETLAQSSEVDGLSQLPQGRIWEAGLNLKIGIGSGGENRGGPRRTTWQTYVRRVWRHMFSAQ